MQAFCYRYPLAAPIVTSFGRMKDRAAVFVRVEDEDGEHGWGEVWCNFPPVGAEHRARLINEMLAPMLVGRAAMHPSEVFDHLTAATSVEALQCGEQGPFAQAIAGVDIAVWDLFARRDKHAAVADARRQLRRACGSMPAASIRTAAWRRRKRRCAAAIAPSS